MYRGGWVLDYPVNSNFMRDLYGSKAAGNTSGYANKEFDQLAAKADKAATLDETVKLYQEAEQVLAKSGATSPPRPRCRTWVSASPTRRSRGASTSRRPRTPSGTTRM
ncbi:hypothetical protein SANTM175S_08477 [Streptomyces antimycoticus]